MLPSVDYSTEGVLLLVLMDNRFLSKIENFISEKKLINEGDGIVIGVSGGADSVALLLCLNALKQKLSLKLFVVHINHGLRKEAFEEAEYVRSLCNSMELPFFLFNFDVASYAKEHSLGTEEAGRKLRYETFDEVLRKSDATKIAVAHNSNDRAETMLFNLVRGTGIKGLSSIPVVRGNIIRPLLCATRAEIEAFLEAEKVRFYTDASNLTSDYTRNRIRNNILPLIESQVNEAAVLHMANTAEQLEKLNTFATGYAQKLLDSAFLDNSQHKLVLDKAIFLKEDDYIKSLLVKLSIDRLVPNNKDITSRHIESVLELTTLSGTRSCNLPYSIVVTSSYDTITFSTDNSQQDRPASVQIVPGDTVSFGRIKVRAELFDYYEGFEFGSLSYTKFFDYDKIKGCLFVRNRQTGDILCTTREKGSKKLKDYMIDEKIPANERDFLPLLAAESDILWVIGYRISEAYKIEENTKRVLKVTVFKED